MSAKKISQLERRRQTIQAELDAQKTQLERNQLGQFSTPYPLACEVVEESLRFFERGPIRFLDPAIGTGVFYSALQTTKGRRKIATALGFDIDPHYAKPAAKLWVKSTLKYRNADFTTQQPPRELFNLLVCNPPYVRHHHLDGETKVRLVARAQQVAGMQLSGLAGLYTYFIALAHEWMETGGISAWLVPSEFMDVNYGQSVKKYLGQNVTLLRIHRFDPDEVQFDDALVSSAVVWIRHELPPSNHTVRFTFGGSIHEPHVSREISLSTLATEHKWTRFPNRESRNNNHQLPTLGDFFTIKRGLATGSNEAFVLTDEQVLAAGLPSQFLRPLLPSPRHLASDIVDGDANGHPILSRRLFLLDCRLAPEELQERFPGVWRYLEEKRTKLGDVYLLKHRKVWYFQEERPPAPIVCTYMGRTTDRSVNPFRFILNKSQATAANAYHMLYPKGAWATNVSPSRVRAVWEVLQSLHVGALTDEGRIYGGGLHKMEPRELAKVPVPRLAELLGTPEAQMRFAL